MAHDNYNLSIPYYLPLGCSFSQRLILFRGSMSILVVDGVQLFRVITDHLCIINQHFINGRVTGSCLIEFFLMQLQLLSWLMGD